MTYDVGAAPHAPPWPRWIDSGPAALRLAAPRLYVGSEVARELRSSRYAPWLSTGALAAIVDCRGFADGGPVPGDFLDEAFARAWYSLTGRDPRSVLVHCQAGISRSASVAYALLRATLGLPHEEALVRVRNPLMEPRPVTLASARAWVHARRASDRRGR